MAEPIFAKGMRAEKRESSPEWVLASLGIQVEDFYKWAKEHEKASGYVNVDIKRSKSGKVYCELNDWTPQKKEGTTTSTDEDDSIDVDSIPF